MTIRTAAFPPYQSRLNRFAVVLFALFASTQSACRSPQVITSEPPSLPDASELSPFEGYSSISVPVSLAGPELLSLAHEELPARFRFPMSGYARALKLNRGEPAFGVTSDGRMEVSIPMSGSVDLPILNDPTFRGRLRLATGLGIAEDFRLSLHDAAGAIDVYDADWGPVGLEAEARRAARKVVPELVRRLDTYLASLELPADLAQAVWRWACTEIGLGDSLYLQLVPRAIRADDFSFSADGTIGWRFGLDLSTEILSASLLEDDQLDCGDPGILGRYGAGTGGSGGAQVWLPVRLDYGDLNGALNRYVSGQTLGPGGRIEVQSAVASSVDGKLAVRVELTGRRDGWFSRRVSMAVYMLASPVLKVSAEGDGASSSMLGFENVELDTTSRSVFVDRLGETAEPLLVGLVSAFTVDLETVYEQVLGQFDEFLTEVEVPGVGVSVGRRRVFLDRVDIGSEALRLVWGGTLEGLKVSIDDVRALLSVGQ